jgi:indolepyruvate ferredoxin oxidoreductase beta subunit
VKSYNVYMCGVGGQGIGVLAEVMIQACLSAGYNVKGVDTHGLAQRGGIVVSHLRLGEKLFTPRIPTGGADVILALERLEAYRAITGMAAQGATAVYYDLEFQPIHVRMGKFKYPSAADLEEAAAARDITVERVHIAGLPDVRMQNTALLGRLGQLGVIEGVTSEIIEGSLRKVLPEHVLEANLEIFHSASRAATT